MASLRDQFAHFYVPDEDTVAAALRTGFIVLDTNVLLNLYRFQSGARNELLSTLAERVKDRLWIPHQVAHEFHKNRLGVIAAQERYFNETLKDIDAAIEGLRQKARAFGTRIALAKQHLTQIEGRIDELQRLLDNEVKAAEQANDVHLDGHESDDVLARLEDLFRGRVGEPMTAKELEDAQKEARRRVDAEIPPGFKDKSKLDPTGDYIVWRQLLDEAKKRKLPTVLVTDDHKDDWYRREHGLTLGAHHELRAEMMREAGVPFLIMRTETFLRYARKYLRANVSAETVDQASELSNPPGAINDERAQLEARIWSLRRLLDLEIQYQRHGREDRADGLPAQEDWEFRRLLADGLETLNAMAHGKQQPEKPAVAAKLRYLAPPVPRPVPRPPRP